MMLSAVSEGDGYLAQYSVQQLFASSRILVFSIN